MRYQRSRAVIFGKHNCRNCGKVVTNNALGRASHERSNYCRYVGMERRGQIRVNWHTNPPTVYTRTRGYAAGQGYVFDNWQEVEANEASTILNTIAPEWGKRP